MGRQPLLLLAAATGLAEAQQLDKWFEPAAAIIELLLLGLFLCACGLGIFFKLTRRGEDGEGARPRQSPRTPAPESNFAAGSCDTVALSHHSRPVRHALARAHVPCLSPSSRAMPQPVLTQLRQLLSTRPPAADASPPPPRR